jgi:recombinational DNA repair ATPase RecF
VGNRVQELDRALADCHQDLIASILDHMDALAGHASELQVKAAKASPEVVDAIDAQLHELQVRVRKYRAELTATLGMSAARVRQCMDHLRLAAALKAESKPEIEEHINHLEETHQTVRADVRRLEKEGQRAWHELAGDFRHSWQALCESVGRAERGYR